MFDSKELRMINRSVFPLMRRVSALHVVVLAGLVAAGLSVSLRAEILEQVLVKVNGDIVTKADFERMQVEFLRQRPDLQNVTADSPELQKAVAESTPQLILSAIDELLLVQRGRELGYVMNDEQFKSVLENIKKDNNIDTDEKFQEALKQEGMTLADLRRQLEKNMLETRVQQNEVLAKISVTEDEARVYYDAHKNEFTTPSEIMLREILITVPTTDRGVNAAQDDAAKAKAEEIRHRLLAGEPFARLAGEVSDASSKTNGGLIGPIKVDELAPALQTMLGKIKVGEVSEVIRTQRGYQLLELESRTDTKVKTFEEAHQDISDRIAEDKRRGETQKYLEKLRATATITWHNDELKKAYEQALAERQKQLESEQSAQSR
jgi:parvulin-like peptidyl-prolyl isomerase